LGLFDDIKALCDDERFDPMIERWKEQLEHNVPKLEDNVNRFREWGALRAYTSFSKTVASGNTFSLRYLGQEVGILTISKEEVKLKISKNNKNESIAKKYFNFDKEGTFHWRSPEAKEFRKHFGQNPRPLKKIGIEHLIEAEFLKQMAIRTRDKFGGSMRNIQPVLLAGCPFQFPMPISGHKGTPKLSKGNVDILARRGVGKGIKISIWELKKPGKTDEAIKQAYIYSVTLIKMLRSKSGQFWYRDIIGFNGQIPHGLEVECVVAVSLEEKQRPSFEKKLLEFYEVNTRKIGNDTIIPYVAHYEWNELDKTTVNVKLFQLAENRGLIERSI